MTDFGHKETDRLLRITEREIAAVYKQAAEEAQAKLDDYMRRFEIKDEKWRIMVANGEKTQQEYKQWRIGQIMIGQRWEEMRDTLAADYHNANVIARSLVGESLPDVYAINHNYATFQVEKSGLVDTSYTLYDHDTVERIMRDNPDLLPAPGKNMRARIAAGKDIAWQEGQIQSVTLQSILQGESIPNMAKRIANTMGETNHKSTIRYARTAVTGAQNAGRESAYKRAAGMGIKIKRIWRATLDGRTRHEHRLLDGQVRAIDEPFEVDGEEIMFPGDPSAPGHLIWNCRCRTRADVDGWDKKSSELRESREIEGMSYEEWKNAKAQSQPITLPEEKAEAIKRSYIRELYGGKALYNDDEGSIIEKKAIMQILAGQHISDDVVLGLDENGKIVIADKVTGAGKKNAKEYVEVAEAWSGNYYSRIRSYQNGNIHDPDVLKIVAKGEKTIEAFIAYSPKWNGGTTYRAIGVPQSSLDSIYEKMRSGERIDMLGTSSWTSSEEVARSHLVDGARVIFVSPTQTSGISIMAYSETPYEYEVVVSKKATYGITKIVEREEAIYVYLEE